MAAAPSRPTAASRKHRSGWGLAVARLARSTARVGMAAGGGGTERPAASRVRLSHPTGPGVTVAALDRPSNPSLDPVRPLPPATLARAGRRAVVSCPVCPRALRLRGGMPSMLPKEVPFRGPTSGGPTGSRAESAQQMQGALPSPRLLLSFDIVLRRREGGQGCMQPRIVSQSRRGALFPPVTIQHAHCQARNLRSRRRAHTRIPRCSWSLPHKTASGSSCSPGAESGLVCLGFASRRARRRACMAG